MTRPEVQGGRRRVLLIDLGAQFGGVENYLVSLAELLAGDVDLYGLCVLPELCTRLADSRGEDHSPADVSRSVQAVSLSGGTYRRSSGAAAIPDPYGTTQRLS